MKASFSYPKTYSAARVQLLAARLGWVRLGNNTKLEFVMHEGERLPAVVHHSTPIIIWYPDNTVRLDNGGHYSTTTKGRLCDFLRQTGLGYLWQAKHVWYVSLGRNDLGADNQVKLEFSRGMLVKPTGNGGVLITV